MSIDLEIAQAASLKRITEIADAMGVRADDLIPYGWTKAKVPLPVLEQAEQERTPGRLVLVTAMSPTPAGEGKTTTSIGLADGLNERNRRRVAAGEPPTGQAVLALREPSLGPVFGMKGGAAGGGYAQVVPMEDINLHFTGDFNAIALANNLAATMLDNHMHHGNPLDIDPRRVHINRVMDLNDRALRNTTIGLGGVNGGVPREDHFDIVVASEVMAVFCLATSLADLRHRLSRIVVAHTRDRIPVTVEDIGAAGAMTALLRDALSPNLVQTLEHSPAFIHGGPFANIAHGCNSALATRAAMALGDWAITEAGFGADLGAEKFLDIKCRVAGIWPDVVCVVGTVRALKYHGGVDKTDLEMENVDAMLDGMVNLEHHLTVLQDVYGLTPVVSLNRFPSDTDAEIEAAIAHLAELGVRAESAEHWAKGGEGCLDLADAVIAAAAENEERGGGNPRHAYDLASSSVEKIEQIATRIYRASSVEVPPAVQKKLDRFVREGYGDLPVCIAKTQYSLSSDPSLRGAPEGHVLTVRDVRLSAGAGFIVVICGDIMTMPGLPKDPAAYRIDVAEDGTISGLF
ncbi:formate--tetrahydrofolate ligase [Brevibacterium yomogidense]|uniref:Formate--tetrahydrofolate ligase n=1 Tax=Brevibacterium yomogidense TaxID=946573 RepID=A0A1X6X835_9MICO|nr:formate--tetrahydrofolate ligase [Brevibacterium yomogidense]SLM95273.1 Formate--tetrahydrofolate ligase [Brevibacterium yomogidense]